MLFRILAGTLGFSCFTLLMRYALDVSWTKAMFFALVLHLFMAALIDSEEKREDELLKSGEDQHDASKDEWSDP